MRRYLIVANQTLLGDHLVAKIRECLLAGPCQFYVVVPASHPRDYQFFTEGHDRAVAQPRLDEALERFRAAGAEVEGEVGDARPIDAIKDVLLRQPPFDEIIVSTLPKGVSHWLRQDLPHRISRAFERRVTVVTAKAAVAKAGAA